MSMIKLWTTIVDVTHQWYRQTMVANGYPFEVAHGDTW